MRFVVVSLALVLLQEVNGGCPVKCTCTDNSVNCISKSLEHVPVFDTLDNTPVIIDISGNDILDITADDFSFDTAEDVREVYLNNSQIALIENMAFDELTNLQELYLANNLLKDLPRDFVVFNENLILLDLTSNHFVDMPRINSTSLEVLILASCGITKVGTDVLHELPKLKILMLQQNDIKYINPITFQNMPGGFFVKLTYNPWNCDCKTYKLFNYLNYRDFANLTEPILCQKHETKEFIPIYNTKHVPAIFEECTKITADDTFLNVGDLISNLAESSVESHVEYNYQDDEESIIPADYLSHDDIRDVVDPKVARCDFSAEETLQQTVYHWYLISLFGFPLSFFFGIAVGIFVAYRYFMWKFRLIVSSSESESSISGLLPRDLPFKPNV